MKPRTAIILATALAIVFGAVAINKWVRSTDVPDDETGRKDARDRKIFPKASSGAKRLVVTPRRKAEEVVLEYIDRKWRLTRPIPARADAGRVAGIKDMLSDMVYERMLEADDKENDRKLTGLGDPRWTVTMVDELDVSRVVKIGNRLSRMGSSGIEVYVEVDGKVYVVARDFTAKLRGSASDFRIKKVFDVKSDDIVAVAVAGTENYSLVKADGKWRVGKPVKALADDKKATELIGKIESLEIAEYVADSPDSLVRYGLNDPPALGVKITVQQPAPDRPAGKPTSKPTTAPAPRPTVQYTLALGRKTDEDRKVFARLVGEKSVFTVDVAALGDLQPKLLDLRDKKIVTVSPFMTSRIELDIAGAKGTLVRKGRVPTWTVALPEKGKGSKEAIDKLLEAIGKLEATNFDDAANAVELRGLASPRARIMVQSFTSAMLGRPKPDGPKVTILVGAEGPGGVAVMREGGGVALVTKDAVKVLLQRPAKYMDPTLLDLAAAQPKEKITAITLLRLKTEPVKLAVRKDGNWQMKAPIDIQADRDNVINLLDRLENLKATEIVAVGPKAHENYAKSNAKIALEVTTESRVEIPTSQPTTKPGEKPASRPASKPAPKFKTVVKKYRIHVVLSGIRAYAWIGGRDTTVVGEFESKLFAELSGEFRNRRLWELDAESVSRIKIMPGKDEHVLRREGDRWRYTARAGFKVDPDKVKNFLKDLKDLKALRFVRHARATQKELKEYGLDEPWLTLVLTTDNGITHRIVVAARGADKTANRYAMVDGVAGVFLLSSDDIGKLSKLPEGDFEKK